MKSLFFCYECGSTIESVHPCLYNCPQCEIVTKTASSTFFNYSLGEFINSIYGEITLWWEECLLHEVGCSIYLVELPPNYWIIPKNKVAIVNSSIFVSPVTIEDIS